VLTCYHGWNDNCDCRKPKSGLFTLTQHLFDINWNETLYIGDQERDCAVSNSLGIDFYQVSGETDSLADTIEEWVNSKSKIRKVHN
jgi:D-glycero-D-manno-heptose 1,7-bisphosphate phosphatase